MPLNMMFPVPPAGAIVKIAIKDWEIQVMASAILIHKMGAAFHF